MILWSYSFYKLLVSVWIWIEQFFPNVTGLGLTEITDPNKYKVVAHGTYSRNWSNIQKYGLSRMRVCWSHLVGIVVIIQLTLNKVFIVLQL